MPPVGWTWQALDGWGPMVNLGVFGMLMIVLELFAFEVVTILSGKIHTIVTGYESGDTKRIKKSTRAVA